MTIRPMNKQAKKDTVKFIVTLCCCLLCFLLTSLCVWGAASAVPGEGTPGEEFFTARPSVSGQLHVEGTMLVDEKGEAVQLRGVSTHGLTWFPDMICENLFQYLSGDWNANLIRLAMYSAEYCNGKEEESLALMKKGIDLAVANDMYVLVDWHILEDNDPNHHLEEALAFFDQISSEYAGVPNLIFEICNEPNGDTQWSDIMRYCDQVIPVIRSHSPDAVVLAGTPEYDRNLGSPLLQPLAYDNVMYVLHFYAASHKEGLRAELSSAHDAGLPVFVSECGISEESGDGRLDFGSAAEWFSYLNSEKISYAVWSLSYKEESSAFFMMDYDPVETVTEKDLTLTGMWVRELVRGTDPRQIPVPASVIEKGVYSRLWSRILVSLGKRGYKSLVTWPWFAMAAGVIFFVSMLLMIFYHQRTADRFLSYDDLIYGKKRVVVGNDRVFPKIALPLSFFFTVVYLCWRIRFSVPIEAGVFPVIANLILLFVEVLGFVESLIFFANILSMNKHPLPDIPEESYPDVDVFIATYNEPVELLRRTINGCVQMEYPDRSKVHIWVCDDNRRPEMRSLAEEMGVGYFDRPDNKGAKAGNLNHALSLTSAPYVVTFDADMIPQKSFLLKTIPYFVDYRLRTRPEGTKEELGFLQTPQCFYDPDVFQHALYSEKRIPNEQDFFYRTIEPAKTSTNSVIYGGSNTILSRKALEEIGGFYTESITEDFATGLLIEAAGFMSLGLDEPLASGQTPHTYREHIQQRIRWGRGVIATSRQLKFWRNPGLSGAQKINYWSSVIYWYSPLKNLIYILSPLLYGAFAVPVFKCNWMELLVFWLPMFIMQDICLRVNSRNTISTKWSGIYETSVMPLMLIPVLKETLGLSLSAFKVTDKSGKSGLRQRDMRAMWPFIILVVLSVTAVIRIFITFNPLHWISLVILLYWIIKNLYFLIFSLFLIDGRDSDTEPVVVYDAVPVCVESREGEPFSGVTTRMTEHSVTVYLDEAESLNTGNGVKLSIEHNGHKASLSGVVTDITISRLGTARTHKIEILDFGDDLYAYWGILYDRLPTLPQSYTRDFNALSHLWQNIAYRVARTAKL